LVEPTVGDLGDPRFLQTAVSGVTTVIHLAAAVPGNRHKADAFRRVNVEGTRNLVRAAAEAGVRRFVLLSSAGVYGSGTSLAPRDESTVPTPETAYERSKLEAEHAVVEALAGTPATWVIIRPAGMHGPGRAATLALYRQVRDRRLWIHGPSTVIVHPTYVGDVVRGVMLTLSNASLRNEVFNIAGPEALPYSDLIRRLATRLGAPVRQIHVPARPTRALVSVLAATMRSFGHPVSRLERLTSPVINRSIDCSKARRLLGFEPYPLDEGIDATISWARKERLL
jgi:nucleoside-diphosphate-sugar epimerase